MADGSVHEFSKPMNLPTELCLDQAARWSSESQRILAHYDAHTIVVYQAYRRSIGTYVVKHSTLGGDFSYSRMSWIKPNFLWMMSRSGWGTKQGQEVILGLRLRRQFFDVLLACAVASTFKQSSFSNPDDWVVEVRTSHVRLQLTRTMTRMADRFGVAPCNWV